MNYRQSITYLFNLQRFGIKLGLSNITILLQQLNNPHKKLRCIHIAGTNGKGSTAAFLQSIIKEAGYKTGLFTSPHLVNFTERIKINDKEIKKGRVVQLIQQIRNICKNAGLDGITFFEFVTAMAFAYFAEERADPVIVETGMGGRLDATNVVQPLVTIITSVSLEHQMYLGNTLAMIAKEKAGIIKMKTPLITGATQPRVIKLFSDKCKQLGSNLYQVGKEITINKTGSLIFDYRGLHINLAGLWAGLIGDHQLKNASMALAAAELLSDRNFSIQQEHMRNGIQFARWPGRMEVVRHRPIVVLDGAHNPEAWKVLAKTVTEYFNYNKLIIVIGVMQDKDISQMIEILTPKAHTVIFCKPKMERAATQEIIMKYVRHFYSKKIVWITDTMQAVDSAIAKASSGDLVCVTGSLFTVGEAREHLLPGRRTATGRVPM